MEVRSRYSFLWQTIGYALSTDDISQGLSVMTLQELQQQILQLPLQDRWYLVQSLLASIQQETASNINTSSDLDKQFLASLDPWTQSLVGVVQLDTDRVI